MIHRKRTHIFTNVITRVINLYHTIGLFPVLWTMSHLMQSWHEMRHDCVEKWQESENTDLRNFEKVMNKRQEEFNFKC